VCWLLEIQEISAFVSLCWIFDIGCWVLNKKNIQCKILNNQYPNVKSAFVSLCWLFDIVYWLLEIQEMLEIRYCVLDIGNSGNSQCKILNYQYPGAGQMAPCSSLKNRKLNNNTNLKKE
jgi:hypothetical protein